MLCKLNHVTGDVYHQRIAVYRRSQQNVCRENIIFAKNLLCERVFVFKSCHTKSLLRSAEGLDVKLLTYKWPALTVSARLHSIQLI